MITSDASDALRRELERDVAYLGAQAAAVLLSAADGSRFALLAEVGLSPELASAWVDAPRSAAELADDVCRFGQPLWLPTWAEVVERYPRMAGSNVSMPGARAVLPLQVAGSTVGALSIVFDDRRLFTAADRQLAEAVAARCSERLATVAVLPPPGSAAEAAMPDGTVLSAEELWRVGFGESPLPMAITDAHGQFVRANAAYAALLGLDEADLVGRHASIVCHADDVPVASRSVIELSKGEADATRHRQRFVRADGEVLRVEVDLMALRRDGSLQGVLSQVREVAVAEELRQAEAALQEVAAQLDAVVHGSPIGIALLDRDLRYVQVNEALAAGYERSPEAMVGRRFEGLNPPEVAAQLLPSFRAVLDGGRPVSDLEFAGAGRDEDRRWIASCHPIADAEGLVVGLVAMAFEITDLRRTERRLGEREALLDALLAHAPAGFALFDRDARLQLVNPALARMHGRGIDEQLGERVSEVDPALRAVERCVHDVLDRSAPVLGVEVSDGDRDYACDYYPVVTATGAWVGVGVTVHDVTERRRAEAGLRSIASTLQASLLPPALPAVPGVELASRYVPGGEGLEVGGDFYDVVERPDGGWALFVGDVCGKGVGAAAVTSRARHTLRAAASHLAEPASVLAWLHDALGGDEAERFVTVAYAHLAPAPADPAAPVRLDLILAGHPRPIRVDAGGRAALVGTPGRMLGAWAELSLTVTAVELAPGEALVIPTDGLAEARRPGLEDDEVLALIEAAAPGSDADALAEHVVRAAAALAGTGQPRDDLAVLVLRRPPLALG